MTHGDIGNRDLYRALLENAKDLTTVLDRDGTVRFASPSYERTLGHRPEALVGTSAFDRLHPDDRGKARLAFAQALQQPGVPVSMPLRYQHAEGSWRILDVTGTNHLNDPVIQGFIINAQDVTDRVRAYELLEQRVAERTRELTALLDVARQVGTTLDLNELLQLVLDQMHRLVEFQSAGIGLFEEHTLVVAGYRNAQLTLDLSGDYDASSWNGFSALRRGEHLIIDDVQGDGPAAAGFRRLVGEAFGIEKSTSRAFLAVPMMHHGQLTGVVGLVHQQPAYYNAHHGSLVRAVADVAAGAVENARLYERAQDRAVLSERQRLARELHDSVSQALYGVSLGAQTARGWLGKDGSKVDEALGYVLDQAEAGLAEMRALIFDLSPETLHREGLVAALRKQAAAAAARQSIVIDTRLGPEPDVTPEVREALYRVAQEALRNVIQHAQATRATVSLELDQEHIVLQVRDDGVGFLPEQRKNGPGMRTMEAQMTRFDGRLEVRSAPGKGSTISARVPRPLPVAATA